MWVNNFNNNENNSFIDCPCPFPNILRLFDMNNSKLYSLFLAYWKEPFFPLTGFSYHESKQYLNITDEQTMQLALL